MRPFWPNNEKRQSKNSADQRAELALAALGGSSTTRESRAHNIGVTMRSMRAPGNDPRAFSARRPVQRAQQRFASKLDLVQPMLHLGGDPLPDPDGC